MVNAQWGSMRPNPHNQKLSANTPTMASIADFPAKDMTWSDASDKGVFSLMQAKHPEGYIALQLPPGDFGVRRHGPQVLLRRP